MIKNKLQPSPKLAVNNAFYIFTPTFPFPNRYHPLQPFLFLWV